MELKEFFAAHPKIALAFSGGVDSAYLLYAAKQLGAEVRAYYVKTAFQPQFELDDAKRLVEALHADMTVLCHYQAGEVLRRDRRLSAGTVPNKKSPKRRSCRPVFE